MTKSTKYRTRPDRVTTSTLKKSVAAIRLRYPEQCVWRHQSADLDERFSTDHQGLRRESVALLIGDVSFLHDLSGSSCLREARSPLVVVVIQNGGGRIFDLLPIASRAHGLALTVPKS